MNFNLRKMIPVLIAAITVAAPSFAGGSDNKCPERCCETSCDHCNGTCGPVLSPTGPMIDSCGYDLHVSVVYETARVKGTEFAYSDANPNGSLPINGSVLTVKNSMDWGFQVGAGYTFEHDDWRAALNYMYFRSNNSTSGSSGFGTGFVPINVVTDLIGVADVDNAKSDLKLNFNMLDFYLARGNYMGCAFSLAPRAGIKTGWVEFQQTSSYSGGGLGTDLVTSYEKSKFWGIGPEAGLYSRYDIGCSCFNIWGDFEMALLFGNHKLVNTQTLRSNMSNNVNLRETVHDMSPTARMAIGLGYEKTLCECKQHIAIRAGLDVQYWWDQYGNFEVQGSAPTQFHTTFNDFSLHGLIVDAQWSF